MKLEETPTPVLQAELTRLMGESTALKRKKLALRRELDRRHSQETLLKKVNTLSPADRATLRQLLDTQSIPSAEAIGNIGK